MTTPTPAPDQELFVRASDVKATAQAVAEVLAGDRRWVVIHGEALRVLDSLPDASVDALISDPPYSSGGLHRGDRAQSTTAKYVVKRRRNTRSEFAGDSRDQRSYLKWCALWIGEATRVLKPRAPVELFTDWRQVTTLPDAMQVGGVVYRGLVPWDKTKKTRPQKGSFMAQCEYIVWGSVGPRPDLEVYPGGRFTVTDEGDSDGRLELANGERVGSITQPVDFGTKNHQTGKPPELLEKLCEVIEPGGVVLDPFAGGGSTGVGALRAGRRVILVELTEHYAQAAAQWLTAEEQGLSAKAFTDGQTAMFAAG